MSDYSRGDYADLPAGTTDLENNYTAPDLTAIASNDNSTYAEQTANNEIAIHQYKKTVTGQYTNITWSGKSSLAPSESPVIMEVYNVNGTVWEELDRDDSTAADTDFDIIYNNLATADYLDSGVITWRVYQAASAGPHLIHSYDVGGSSVMPISSDSYGGSAGQTFQGDGSDLTSAKFYLYRNDDGLTGNCYAKLYATSAGVPTDVLRTSDPLAVGGFPVLSLELKEFTFSTPYTLDNDTWYAMVCEFTGGGGGSNVYIARDTTTLTDAGTMVRGGPGSWVAETDQEVLFYVYGE